MVSSLALRSWIGITRGIHHVECLREPSVEAPKIVDLNMEKQVQILATMSGNNHTRFSRHRVFNKDPFLRI